MCIYIYTICLHIFLNPRLFWLNCLNWPLKDHNANLVISFYCSLIYWYIFLIHIVERENEGEKERERSFGGYVPFNIYNTHEQNFIFLVYQMLKKDEMMHANFAFVKWNTSLDIPVRYYTKSHGLARCYLILFIVSAATIARYCLCFIVGISYVSPVFSLSSINC